MSAPVAAGRTRRARVWAVMAGGGTGGHVYPGLAVAGAGVRSGRRPEDFHFVVSRRALDSEVVTAAGYGATAVSARGLKRRLGPSNLVAAVVLLRGLWQCWRLLGRRRPLVVLAQGGYVSAACAAAARLRRIPVVVLEANATAGLANRVTARWAAVCAVALPGTALAGRVEVTGLPVRAEIGPGNGADGELRRQEARRRLGVDPARRLVLVLGGSLGAARLNEAVTAACERLAERGDLALRHVVGGPAEVGAAPPAGAPSYEAVRYEHDVATALAAADVVVSRAGGGAVAELAAAGRAAVLVPLAGATGGHQAANAAAAAAGGGAVVLTETELSGERLAGLLAELLDDPARLAGMEQAAAGAGEPGADERVLGLMGANALAERPGP